MKITVKRISRRQYGSRVKEHTFPDLVIEEGDQLPNLSPVDQATLVADGYLKRVTGRPAGPAGEMTAEYFVEQPDPRTVREQAEEDE